MKRKVAKFMLIVFAFYATGGYLSFQIGQQFNTSFIYSEHSQKTILKFSHNALPVFIKKNKEFKFNGEMYDVISKTEEDGFVYYTVVHDKHETRLLKALKQLISLNSDNGNHKNNTNKSYSHFSIKDCIPQSIRLLLFQKPTELLFGNVISENAPVFIFVITPPPQG